MVVRTRYAPSPTGYMHIGNLRAALIEYLVAKSNKGQFILRIEDTDQKRLVEGSVDVVYRTLRQVGLIHDEGPDIGGEYGPYVQSERKQIYIDYAKKLVESGGAYYCFCSKEDLEKRNLDGTMQSEQSDTDDVITKYDRRCYHLDKEEIDRKLSEGSPYVIRQLIPDGKTTFTDEVFGDISVDNEELDDQILLKSDGLPTYNFANVVDDHLMKITHVVRGVEYLSSAPKYNLLYSAFGWAVPKYIHVATILNEDGKKLSKRRGDTSFEDLLEMGFFTEAIVNYIALLGWSPTDNREIFSLAELCEVFDIKGLSKSPSTFDMRKLTWFNGEYIKKMPFEDYFKLAEPYLRKAVTREGIDYKTLATITQSRINFVKECAELVDFIDNLPDYEIELYTHKKMKTDAKISCESLKKALPLIEKIDENDWNNDYLYKFLCEFASQEGYKNGQVLWPIRTALSGKPATPCGASELMVLLGKKETLNRINDGIARINNFL